ncbi:hypothetical protein H4R33_000992 [Dimargaris cristalligena]|nr:hypothetical protein H4R33_000992 [Dimargaris cristalligena]
MTASTPAPVSSNSASLPSSAAWESPSATVDCADREATSSSDIPKSNCARPDSNSNTYVKRNGRVHMREVQAMQFIKEHTTIPVPDIYSYHIDGPDSFIEMERIAGITLEECIAQNRVTADHRQRIAEQLNDYIQQMRKVQNDVVGPCIWTDSDTEQALYGPFVPFPTPMPMHEAEEFMMNHLLQCKQNHPPTGFTQMFSKHLKQPTDQEQEQDRYGLRCSTHPADSK